MCRYNKCKYSHEDHKKDIWKAILTLAIFFSVPKGYEIYNCILEIYNKDDAGDGYCYAKCITKVFFIELTLNIYLYQYIYIYILRHNVMIFWTISL